MLPCLSSYGSVALLHAICRSFQSTSHIWNQWSACGAVSFKIKDKICRIVAVCALCVYDTVKSCRRHGKKGAHIKSKAEALANLALACQKSDFC